MKKNLLLYIFILYAQAALADHITGGEISYTFGGVSLGQYTYNISLKLFMVCNTTRVFNNPTYVSFFDKGTNTKIKDVSVNLSATKVISKLADGPCITNPPLICYREGYYVFSVTLPASKDGYTLASQVIYRVDNMNNLVTGYDRVGATYTGEIPGNGDVTTAPANNSATFTGDNLIVMCAGNSFSYSFSAKDDDGDKLRYSFCNAYRESGASVFGEQGSPPGNPPYTPVPYGQNYNGSFPLGPNVSINSNTGTISGIAPAEGTYVISICVEEIRNNIVIAMQHKDLQVTITSCTIASATLLPVYSVCGDTKNITLTNISSSSLINTFEWKFTNSKGSTVYSSTQEQVNYTFADTGVYSVKLLINKNEVCTDSTTSSIKVYPGFKAGFIFGGLCMNNPTQFSDTSSSVYGQLNYWNWDFGDNTTPLDISQLQNPSYTYTSTGTKNARLIAGDSKGCTDTAFSTIPIEDKPTIYLSFRDTLICKPDSIQLHAGNSGILTWSPKIFMNTANAQSPVVAPPVTTVYYVDLNDNGCLNHDSVVVNVTDHVTLNAMPDTTICSSDPIPLNIVSDALKYSWTPASTLNDASGKNPVATTSATTNYEVLAAIGSCSAKENILVSTIDYPIAAAGNDTTICFKTQANLQGFTNGSSFIWSPQTYLQNPSSLTTVALPSSTTSYILTAYDTKGCPKPGIDTVTVKVLPDLKAFAGKDTAVVTGQPLQLNATGGIKYEWQPATGLSDNNIANPVAKYTTPAEGIYYTVLVYNEAGCVDTASLTVKVFATSPTVFVPTGFTPNGDGRNDILRPIAAGMQHIKLFNIYNRWGQLVFSTSVNGKGWDGTVNGQQQSSGAYVWMVKAVDYTGKSYIEKGTVVLIR